MKVVTESALVKRINRRLARKDGGQVRRTKPREEREFGRYVTVRNNFIEAWHVDLIGLGHDLKVLARNEAVGER